MNRLELTLSGQAATPRIIQGMQMNGKRRTISAASAILGVLVLSGCITVNAPTEPIVIELNINITADVVLSLAEDADKAIEENADIF
ncbi:YnbE family lipoprotein [Altererythrobacter aestiaquae]|uniref:YnbE family lipoprotein n=1 Tax=Pontixanthobacter aestiaquae TaxID=1509367 RepID=A0A844Z8N4_9SPHN|nr:YnbE family lipoprotein [Pontixanthobacter aestiaquae]MXO83854.1 YnbE family lipoprotein [Pontixanthobacter aestiaquae]